MRSMVEGEAQTGASLRTLGIKSLLSAPLAAGVPHGREANPASGKGYSTDF